MLRRILCNIAFGYLVLLLSLVLFVLISAVYRLVVSPEQFKVPGAQDGAITYMLLFTLGVAVYLALGLYISLALRKNAAVLSAGLFYLLYTGFAVVFIAPTLYYMLGLISVALSN